MIRVDFHEAVNVLKSIHTHYGYSHESADLSSRLFCEANRDGVVSHGLARFPNLISAIQAGRVHPQESPEMVWSGGAMERWDGHQGPGNLNAYKAMQRALELAETFGVGTVALSNTNHWMRGGNFGWQAAEAGKIAICWTNTMPNLPPWGSQHPLIGNNPLIIAVPRKDGHIVLDMAMSQYSYGALEGYADEGRTLPYPGGWDSSDSLSSDPVSILESKRPLPIGFWKGSGLSILLDLTAALLSGGKATHDISPDPGAETGISQIYMAFSPPDHPGLADQVVQSLKAYDEDVSYPGERTLRRRKESDEKGIPVSKDTWDRILAYR